MTQETTLPRLRVIIATPLKGDVPKFYFTTGLQAAVLSKSKNIIVKRGGVDHYVDLDWFFLDGPAVQVARNECVAYAKEVGADELVFHDKDIHARDERDNETTCGALCRLLEWDEDFVCGIYAAHDLFTHWHVQTIDGEEANPENGLQRVHQCAIGFSKIKMSVFKKIEQDNPERIGVCLDPNKPKKYITEFFPMGLTGPNQPENRLKEIRKLVTEDRPLSQKLALIERAANVKYDQESEFRGEDYFFCQLARESGFKVFMDSFLVMGHESHTTMPIPTRKLIGMLGEPWRAEDRARIKNELLAAKNGTKDEIPTPTIVT